MGRKLYFHKTVTLKEKKEKESCAQRVLDHTQCQGSFSQAD